MLHLPSLPFKRLKCPLAGASLSQILHLPSKGAGNDTHPLGCITGWSLEQRLEEAHRAALCHGEGGVSKPWAVPAGNRCWCFAIKRIGFSQEGWVLEDSAVKVMVANPGSLVVADGLKATVS